MEISEREAAAFFKALGDENRIHILKLLRNGEVCACKLLEELTIGQPTLSHHMKILCDAGLVVGRKEGKWMKYSINCESACLLRKLLLDFTPPENRPANCRCEE